MGGCLGCFNCAVSGKCIYKDNFDEYLRNDIQKADAIIYAFSIKDHSMGSRFKLYDDRQFCNGHRTVTIGMPVGYIVSGNLSEENNLKTIIEARAQVGSNNLCSIATNEDNTDASIDKLVKTLDYALLNKYVPPQNFYGIGGMKVFRDLIWLMQGMMRADHKFYKAHKQYDFPQKKWPQMLAMYLVGELIAHDNIKAKIGNKMNEGMIMPYKKVLENAKKEK
jgi:multimeric flavodoxin WrbA